MSEHREMDDLVDGAVTAPADQVEAALAEIAEALSGLAIVHVTSLRQSDTQAPRASKTR